MSWFDNFEDFDQIILRDFVCNSKDGLRKVEKEERYDDLVGMLQKHKKVSLELLENGLIVVKKFKEDK